LRYPIQRWLREGAAVRRVGLCCGASLNGIIMGVEVERA
jgi:hypothetical protein